MTIVLVINSSYIWICILFSSCDSFETKKKQTYKFHVNFKVFQFCGLSIKSTGMWQCVTEYLVPWQHSSHIFTGHLISWPLKMRPLQCLKMKYPPTQHHIPKELIPYHLHNCMILSFTMWLLYNNISGSTRNNQNKTNKICLTGVFLFLQPVTTYLMHC